eukprot:gene19959-biopygen14598
MRVRVGAPPLPVDLRPRGRVSGGVLRTEVQCCCVHQFHLPQLCGAGSGARARAGERHTPLATMPTVFTNTFRASACEGKLQRVRTGRGPHDRLKEADADRARAVLTLPL